MNVPVWTVIAAIVFAFILVGIIAYMHCAYYQIVESLDESEEQREELCDALKASLEQNENLEQNMSMLYEFELREEFETNNFELEMLQQFEKPLYDQWENHEGEVEFK